MVPSQGQLWECRAQSGQSVHSSLWLEHMLVTLAQIANCCWQAQDPFGLLCILSPLCSQEPPCLQCLGDVCMVTSQSCMPDRSDDPVPMCHDCIKFCSVSAHSCPFISFGFWQMCHVCLPPESHTVRSHYSSNHSLLLIPTFPCPLTYNCWPFHHLLSTAFSRMLCGWSLRL